MKINIPVRSAFLATILMSLFSVLGYAKAENGITKMLAIDTPPVAVPDVITTAQKTPAIIAVTANDLAGSAAIDPQSVRLIQPFSGAPVLSFTYLNEGTYTVNQADGTIVFTPVDAFGGVPTTINYTVKDINGLESNQAKITVTVTPTPPTAVADFATTKAGKYDGLEK
ncbi:Ig-like domain-containing protein [Dyadobacter sp. 3J3]|uniref:Ig-like domain-containing protein n=1 Tax=Dyadobacter sp. 3J3 TaxID=2606600 RepID=UPI00135840A4|nr:Ig-like domain-containing protein [Dyadobacter sp. 3J3]